jgi:hypothetical protein
MAVDGSFAKYQCDCPAWLNRPSLIQGAVSAGASESPPFLMVVDPSVNHSSRWTASSLPHRA